MDKLNKLLGVINLLLWTSLFISIIFLNLDTNTLKEFAAGSTFVVVADIVLDILESRGKRKAIIEYSSNEFKGDK
ncbi:hypothetical protein BJV38_003290 [Clostridium beijerinckii]|uniref:hypothetical protein n=1 Tax=Clostridium beijerinckii TaxID=1520 RepID=UPI00156E809C|nr:hypothetical protein [Clostridium beijerinckii]NRT34124.1 hypothetical protein [Clostridium beijerinckii]NRT46447.1 hypothetical protein [Clostridium beijerinckii]NRZ19549.1 hypothetical protein [Clostridium beijerinckii]